MPRVHSVTLVLPVGWEKADESRQRCVLTEQGFAVATETFDTAGFRFVRGVDRLPLGHGPLKNPDVPNPWRLRNR